MLINLRPPRFQWGGHLQSIYPSLFRKVPLAYRRERLELIDGDFLDLDWHVQGSEDLIIVTHGLEGNSARPYVTALLKLFGEHGVDGLGWNCRSCSGEINRLPRFYHHGDAEDLRTVVHHAIAQGYKRIFLSGCSMGGSLTLRLLGEAPERVPKEVVGAFVGSVPLDIYSSVRELDRPYKRFYMQRFLRKLHAKLLVKEQMFPDDARVSCKDFVKIKNFVDFDGRYTAPIHGYASALDFYEKASTKPLLGRIAVPVMIVQALNDPFLGQECYEAGQVLPGHVQLMLTANGGHVGFMESGSFYTWAEKKALEFYQGL